MGRWFGFCEPGNLWKAKAAQRFAIQTTKGGGAWCHLATKQIPSRGAQGGAVADCSRAENLHLNSLSSEI